MPPAKKSATPVAAKGADPPSSDVKKAPKKIAEPKRTSVKTANGVEIGWVED